MESADLSLGTYTLIARQEGWVVRIMTSHVDDLAPITIHALMDEALANLPK